MFGDQEGSFAREIGVFDRDRRHLPLHVSFKGAFALHCTVSIDTKLRLTVVRPASIQ